MVFISYKLFSIFPIYAHKARIRCHIGLFLLYIVIYIAQLGFYFQKS